jgi:hypothetical protein
LQAKPEIPAATLITASYAISPFLVANSSPVITTASVDLTMADCNGMEETNETASNVSQ